jgi:hypothetical protein
VCFYAFYPYEPIRIEQIEINKTVVQRGEAIMFHFKGEKLMAVPVHATIELVNGERIAAISYTSNNPPGDKFPWRRFIVPYTAIPGKYRIKWTGVYEVNPIRSIVVMKYSDPIEVN